MRSSELMILFNKKAVVLLVIGAIIGIIMGYVMNNVQLGVILGIAIGFAIAVTVNLLLLFSNQNNSQGKFREE